jgi:thiamine pyrophosphate-dependent acetolactate synthase large subunit-like protein
VVLAERLGAPIAGSLKAKGLAHQHPLSVGVSGGLGDPEAARMLKAADLVLAVGASLNAWTTGFGENVGHCPILQIDRSLAVFGVHTPVDLALVGEASASLDLLGGALDDLRRTPWWSNDRNVPDTRYEDGRDGKPDPRRVLDVVNRALPGDRIIVADGGHCVQATCQRILVDDPGNWTYSFDFGCIGQGLGLALGACFARPSRRVTLITGDASLLMNIGDLDTAVRFGLPLTILVLNDGGFGQERHALARKQLPPEYAIVRAPDFVRLARAVGGDGWQVTKLDELEALASSLEDARDGLRLHDVLINGDVEIAASSEIAQRLRQPAQ